jgi:cob(I)alamin adenosyltransferase
MKCGSSLPQNMIAQLDNHSENTVTKADAMGTVLSYDRTTGLHDRVKIVETSADQFCTEIVADALKIASKGQRVLIVQLLKGGIRQGYDRVVNLAQNLDWVRCNLIRNISIADLNDLELHNFHQLWKHVGDVASTGEYSLLILDDLSLSIELGLIRIEAATNFLSTLPEDLEVVLTGTTQHPDILGLVNGEW